MTKLLLGAMIAAATSVSCTKSSEEGGRAGNDIFRIVVPSMAAGVKQGEVQTVRVMLERGEGFTQNVKLEMKAPVGVVIEPNHITVLRSDKGDIQLTATIAKDAAIGEHKILVKGTPDKGEATETEFKISVVAS